MAASSSIDLVKFYPDDLVILTIEEKADSIILYTQSKSTEFTCPCCNSVSHVHHGTYHRRVQDLPLFQKNVWLDINAYEYTCENLVCNVQSMAETFHNFLHFKKRMQKEGFGMRQIRMYAKHDAASRRFSKSHRCMLYQGDIKYGPYLPVGKDGQKKQTYLAAWIDDATRFIVSARFYTNQKVDIIEDTLREAILTYGKPEAIYVDNGKQYRSNWLQKACARLGIRLLHAKPYHPEGKGKIEAFNHRLDSFLAEIALQKPNSLEELNHYLAVWLKEKYHKDSHAGLSGVSPETAYLTDKRPLSFPDIDACREAFLHTEIREVDKAGCISFDGQKYEVGLKLVGRKIVVFYDATWKDEVEIHHKDFPAFKAKRLQIGENCGQTKLFPEETQPISAENSRLLTGLDKQSAKVHNPAPVATSFRSMAKELNAHV